MISAAHKIIKFIMDKDSTLYLSEMFEAVGRKHREWQKEIRTNKAVFSYRESFKVRLFLNQTVRDLADAGVCRKQVEGFTRVFNELMDNAFRHGCAGNLKGKISVVCFYSRWFILLKIKDNGSGFNLAEELKRVKKLSENRSIAHGLHVVDSLAYELYSNKKGNSITAILNGQITYEAIPVVESFNGCEILVISILSEDAWYDMIVDWSPLLSIIDNAKQSLILIDLSEVFWPSRSLICIVDTIEKKEKIDKLPTKKGTKFAFIINFGAHYSFNLDSYEDTRPPIFRADQGQKAREWLIRED